MNVIQSSCWDPHAEVRLCYEQAAAGDAHWQKCFDFVKRMVAAVPEEQRKTRPQQPPAGDKAAAADAEKPAAEKPAEEKAAADGEKAAEAGTAADAKVCSWNTLW